MPDIDLRLANVLKALTEVVLPALPDDARFAREQAQLAIGHLQLVATQWPLALRFELGTLAATCALARTLAAHLDSAHAAHAAPLTAALAAAETVDRTDYAAVSAAQRTLAATVNAAITNDQDKAPLSRAVQDAVLAYGARQSLRQRAWLKQCGLDPDGATLAEIDEVLDE